MKLAVVFTIASATFCSAQQCKVGPLDPADFILNDQGDNKYLAPLSAIFVKAGQRVQVSDVFKDGNHVMTGPDNKLAWESKPDFDDLNTAKWVPQGISSTADALDVGTYEGVDGWIVSWHRDDDKSARVTFVDKSSKKYRHALLVYPEAADDFREVPVHAGGIVWYGNTLWVVDTYNGIRVFDMGNIWKVGSGDGVGKKADGTYSAAGYIYVIPQIRWYKWTPSAQFRHSFIALDRTATPDRLLLGEYQSSGDLPTRIVQYQLDYTTRKLVASGTTVRGVWAYCVGILRMQGAVSVNNQIFISQSNGESKGDLFSWVPGNTAKEYAGFFPPSPEDLSYNKHGDEVYGLTEAAGGRYIITFKRPSVV
ncbi:hypothetical protein HJFPF1_07232 [Paramyrothecium foliicola]|nr:hypothetical protein HJFPF1_07232 [Paramyrothecium foliicola]